MFSINYFYKYLKKDGYYVIEDYKFSNYFKKNNDVNENTIDVLIKKLKNKKVFNLKYFKVKQLMNCIMLKLILIKEEAKYQI